MSRVGWGVSLTFLAGAVFFAVLAADAGGSNDANGPIAFGLLIGLAVLALLAAVSVMVVSSLRKSRRRIRDAERGVEGHS